MSGVYIPGMEMPTNCGDCRAFVCYRQWAGDCGDCFCGITKSNANEKTKNADCPLVPVPPHGRLIDADALLDGVTTKYGWFEVDNEDVMNAPTIIPADKDGEE